MITELHKAQIEIAKDTHRFRVLNCGRRFGKTTLSVYEMLGVATAKKDRRVSYFAPTRDDAREIAWSEILKIASPLITYTNDSRLELKVRTQDGGESIIKLNGWEAVKQRGKGRGTYNDFIVLDEVAKYKDFWAGWRETLMPTLIDTKGSALFTSTPVGFNHFYDLYNLENIDEDYKSFHYTTYDNPYIPVEEIERAKRQMTEDEFAQEHLADFRKMEGLVYKEFNRDKHLFDIKDLPISLIDEIPVAGLDFGYTHPTGIIYIKKDSVGRLWITDEYYKTGKTDEEIAEILKNSIKYVYPDPERPQGIEVLRRNQVNVREVIKGKDSVETGINQVRELLKQNRIKIAKHCINLINELESYQYDDNGKPIKENDHLLDALRYYVMMNMKYEKQIPIGQALKRLTKKHGYEYN